MKHSGEDIAIAIGILLALVGLVAVMIAPWLAYDMSPGAALAVDGIILLFVGGVTVAIGAED